jgi:proline dehydrogenase
MNNRLFTLLSTKLGLLALKIRLPLSEWLIYKTLFRQFVGGRTLMECQKTVDGLSKEKVLTMLDIGIERSKTKKENERVLNETLNAINFASINDAVPVITTKITGLGRMELLEKWGQSKLNTREQEEFDELEHRLRKICRTARDKHVGVFIDAEESWIQDAIHHLALKMIKEYNIDEPIVYNTYQMYRRDKLEELKEDLENAKKEGYILAVKLVRGAYMEKENEYAENKGIPSVIHQSKQDCDRDYNAALKLCLDNYQHVSISNATHNMDSIRFMVQYILDHNLPRDHRHFNFCQLYGMGDFLTYNLADAGFLAAKYVPYGKVRDVFPYLVRRAEENSSVSGEVSRELKMIQLELVRRKKLSERQQ